MAADPSRSALDPASDAVLYGIRDLRLADGGCCPRCDSTAVIRWGSFSGRQRYRCHGCGRTFSDLTGTALAYTKRLHSWRDYLLRFRDAESLRRTASALGIHVSTAFRWRHRVLQCARRGESAAMLQGRIELSAVVFAYSCKGTRLPAGTARSRGARLTSVWTTTPHVHLILARDRLGFGDAFQLAAAVANARELTWHFQARIARSSILMLGYRSWTPFASAARSCELAFHPVSDSGRYASDRFRHVRNVTAYRRRFLTWLPRFRGVATHYLSNYCAWHRMVDRDAPAAWLHSCFGHVCPVQLRPTRPP